MRLDTPLDTASFIHFHSFIAKLSSTFGLSGQDALNHSSTPSLWRSLCRAFVVPAEPTARPPVTSLRSITTFLSATSSYIPFFISSCIDNLTKERRPWRSWGWGECEWLFYSFPHLMLWGVDISCVWKQFISWGSPLCIFPSVDFFS